MLARDESSLKCTALHALHVARGGKMVPFAGYEMPVQYAAGVLREHLHTRSHAGLFDVSHMGQLALRPKSGKLEDAALALERLVPQDIVAVAPGRAARFSFPSAWTRGTSEPPVVREKPLVASGATSAPQLRAGAHRPRWLRQYKSPVIASAGFERQRWSRAVAVVAPPKWTWR